MMALKVLKKEVIEINKDQVETLHIQPYMKGISEKRDSDNWHFWVTDDGNFVPVKMLVNMKVGSFKAVLKKRTVGQKKAPLYKNKAVQQYNPLTGF